MFTFTTGLIVGALLGGAACAVSAKTLGWFNKQVRSAEAKVASEVK